MRSPADKIFSGYALIAAVAVLGITLLYPPLTYPSGIGHAAVRLSWLTGLAALVIARFAGPVLGGVAAVALVAAWIVLAIVLGDAPALDADVALDVVAFGMAVVAGAVYVGSLGDRVASAKRSEEQHALIVNMGVDLVPRSLDDEALSRLLSAVEVAARARHVAVYWPSGHDRFSGATGACPAGEGCSTTAPAVAALMIESHRAAEAAGGAAPAIEPLITSRSEVYLPIVAASGIEGVLHAARGLDGGRWSDREIEFLTFAANLVSALLERDRLEERLAHVQAAEEADRLKSNIVLSVSHDLKTPLAAATARLTGITERLADDACDLADPSVDEDLGAVREDLKVLDRRITELIDIARLESASWKSTIDWNDVADAVTLVRDAVDPAGRARLRAVNLAAVPPMRFDVVQIGRALLHVVENALSYSPPEEPVVIEVGYDDAELRIAVTDAGPGLAPGEERLVFEKFRRGSAGTLVPHGSGLGLAIAEAIVAEHGGRIAVENVEPHGARFTIVLPRREEGAT